ncbi:MAG: DUF3108 domain-containing protein [Dokdonella sp.]|nr:DUF3108 domain-containing protein [Dokdonella sp.]
MKVSLAFLPALAAILTAATATAAAAPAAPLQPFQAQYAVSRNGSELGTATLTLRSDGTDAWTFRSHTQGTQGLARMAGVDVTEQSSLRWRDGRLETTAYDFQQDAMLKKRSRHGTFDWSRGEVVFEDQGRSARHRLEPGTLDRHAVTLAIAIDLARGGETFDYPVAGSDGVQTMHYRRDGQMRLDVPAGTFDTVRVTRERGPRVSTSWHAADIGWLPVQIEQRDGKKNETITLRLTAFDRD